MIWLKNIMQGFRDTVVLTMDFKSILLKNQDVEEVGVSANNFTSFNCRIRGDCREPCIFPGHDARGNFHGAWALVTSRQKHMSWYN